MPTVWAWRVRASAPRFRKSAKHCSIRLFSIQPCTPASMSLDVHRCRLPLRGELYFVEVGHLLSMLCCDKHICARVTEIVGNDSTPQCCRYRLRRPQGCCIEFLDGWGEQLLQRLPDYLITYDEFIFLTAEARHAKAAVYHILPTVHDQEQRPLQHVLRAAEMTRDWRLLTVQVKDYAR